jgi:hypothetical protein
VQRISCEILTQKRVNKFIADGSPLMLLSAPTWLIHLLTVGEWLAALLLLHRYGTLSRCPTLRLLALAMLPCRTCWRAPVCCASISVATASGPGSMPPAI